MIGEPHHFFLCDEILPAGPSQQDQECKTAEAASYTCLRENLRIVVVAVIHDESVINRFVKRKHLLQRPQSSSGDRMIEKDSPGPVQHPNPASLTHFQGFVACKPLQRTAYPEPGYQRYGKNHDQARSHEFLPFPPAERDQDCE